MLLRSDEPVQLVEGIVRPSIGPRYQLHAGNAAYAADTATWWRNGARWDRAGYPGNVPRPLDLG